MVSDSESPIRQQRNAERRKQFASENSAAAKAENEDFTERSLEDLESLLRMEDHFINDEEGRARRLLANITYVASGVIRERSSSIRAMDQVKNLISWDERTHESSVRRYKRAKKAYRALTGSKWKNK